MDTVVNAVIGINPLTASHWGEQRQTLTHRSTHFHVEMEDGNEDIGVTVPFAESHNRLVVVTGRELKSQGAVDGADHKVLRETMHLCHDANDSLVLTFL